MRNSQIAQITIWLLGLVLLNVPSFNLRVGVFNGGDGSLLIPSFYGTILNAFIFYGNSQYLLPKLLEAGKITRYILHLSALFLLVTSMESILDTLYYSTIVNPESKKVFLEIIEGNLLMHLIFFLIPSYLVRFSNDWIKNIGKDKTSMHSPSKSFAGNKEILNIKSHGTLYQLQTKDIIFIESSGNDVTYHYRNTTITKRDSLKNILDKLPVELFIRCHKSFIISIEHVTKMDHDFVYFENKSVPIGRVYRTALLQKFDENE